MCSERGSAPLLEASPPPSLQNMLVWALFRLGISMNTINFDAIKGMTISGLMIGVLGPLMATAWWNSVSRRPASPVLLKWMWIYFGGLGAFTIIAGVVIAVFHLHA